MDLKGTLKVPLMGTFKRRGWAHPHFVWVKAHCDVSGLQGLEQVLASGNDFADQTAKQVVHQYKVSSTLYQQVVKSKLGAVRIRDQVDAFHLHLAFAAIGLDEDRPLQHVAPVRIELVGPPWVVDSPELLDSGFHQVFVVRSLIGFVHCSGLRVVPQLTVAPVQFATSPGLSFFFGVALLFC